MVFVPGLYTGKFHGDEDAPEKFQVRKLSFSFLFFSFPFLFCFEEIECKFLMI